MNAGQRILMLIGAGFLAVLALTAMFLGAAYGAPRISEYAQAAPGMLITTTGTITPDITTTDDGGKLVIKFDFTNVVSATGGSATANGGDGGNVTINGGVVPAAADSVQFTAAPVATGTTRLAICSHLGPDCLEGQPDATGVMQAAFDGRGLRVRLLGTTRIFADDVLQVENVGDFRFTDVQTNTFVADSGEYVLRVSNDRGAQSWIVFDGQFEIIGPADVVQASISNQVKVVIDGTTFLIDPISGASDLRWEQTNAPEVANCFAGGCQVAVFGAGCFEADLSGDFAGQAFGLGEDNRLLVENDTGLLKVTHPSSTGWFRIYMGDACN